MHCKYFYSIQYCTPGPRVVRVPLVRIPLMRIIKMSAFILGDPKCLKTGISHFCCNFSFWDKNLIMVSGVYFTVKNMWQNYQIFTTKGKVATKVRNFRFGQPNFGPLIGILHCKPFLHVSRNISNHELELTHQRYVGKDQFLMYFSNHYFGCCLSHT